MPPLPTQPSTFAAGAYATPPSTELDPQMPISRDPRRLTALFLCAIAIVTFTPTIPSIDPRMTILQRAAIPVCLVSIVILLFYLYFQFRLRLRVHAHHPFVERAVAYYPCILASVYTLLYLISNVVVSPKPFIIPSVLVLSAMLPMMLGPRTDITVQLTFIIASLFPLGLFTLFLFLHTIPPEWLY